MSLSRTAVILVTGLLLSHAGLSSEPPRTSAEKRQRRCYTVRVEAVGSTSISTNEKGAKEQSRRQHRFSAREILDLRFDVLLREQDPSGLVEVALFTPSGNLYETVKAGLDPEDTSFGRATYRGRRARAVTAKLPVAGSHITRRSIYGEWRAEVRLDGNENACAHPTTFVLEP